MKYVCLIYLDERKVKALSEDDRDIFRAAEAAVFERERRRRLTCVAAELCESGQGTTVVRARDGMICADAGPFAVTPEQLSGLLLIEATDLDDALDVASHLPAARVGSIEVRPVRDLAGATGEAPPQRELATPRRSDARNS